MKSKLDLYFLALIPPEPWREKVTKLKEEFSSYNSHHALKSPPHITLIPPFKLTPAQKAEFVEKLDHFSSDQQKFSLSVKDFGAFKPRVIFLDICMSEPLKNLHDALMDEFATFFEDISKQGKRFHPHMTLAFRDLAKPMFYKAWDNYRNKRFGFSFQVEAISLLKHNGKHWEILYEAAFERITSP